MASSSGGHGHTLPVDKLAAYLNGRLPVAANLCSRDTRLTVRKFGFGQSNPTFLLTIRSGDNNSNNNNNTQWQYVLRKKPAGKIVPSAHAVEREYAVMCALYAARPSLGEGRAVPVPEPLLLCTDADVIGTPFYIMEYVQGRIFTNPYMPGVPAKHRAACYADAIRVLANLHAVDCCAIGLAKFGKHSGYYSRQLRRLPAVHDTQCADTAPIPRFQAMAKWLQAHLPTDAVSIVHGDFKIDNLIFHATQPRVIAVLDWEMSTIGHPASDLANLAAAYYIPGTTDPAARPTTMSGLGGIDLAGTGVPSEHELVSAYTKATHRTVPPQEWAFAKAFLFFKYCVISQGIAARVARGSASSSSGARAGAMVPVIAAVAQSVMDLPDEDDRNTHPRSKL